MAFESLNRHNTSIGTMYGMHSSTYFFAIANKEELNFSFLLWFN